MKLDEILIFLWGGVARAILMTIFTKGQVSCVEGLRVSLTMLVEDVEAYYTFLDALSHFYKRFRRSVGPSVCMSRVIFEGEKYAY